MPNRSKTVKVLPVPTVTRLSIYHRALCDLRPPRHRRVCSHELAAMVNNTPAQVRRDLMAVGVTGCPRCGYEATELVERIGAVLSHGRAEHRVALFGIGNLGRAILAHFAGQSQKMVFVAAFDVDEDKIGRVTAGCRCYHLRELPALAASLAIELGVLTVPASAAQAVADLAAEAGIRGLLNFAPVPLRVPPGVVVDRFDIGAALEKVAYFAACRKAESRANRE